MQDVHQINLRNYERFTEDEKRTIDWIIDLSEGYYEQSDKYVALCSRQFLFVGSDDLQTLIIMPQKYKDYSRFLIFRSLRSDNPDIIGSNSIESDILYIHSETTCNGARLLSSVMNDAWVRYAFNGNQYLLDRPTPAAVNILPNRILDKYPFEVEIVDEYPAELFPQPKFELNDADPSAGTAADQSLLRPGKTLEGAAKNFLEECSGGDEYSNNCAHFLSNAFVRAGFTELRRPETNRWIKARCETSAKRPIRARNMWRWFASRARRQVRAIPEPNTGFWAVFQLDESAYWGGHVVIIDTNNWRYYGTGWYSEWKQYAYQW